MACKLTSSWSATSSWGLFQENCYIIGNRRTGEAVCIDPGDEPEEILHLAKDMGVQIKLIANSHAHIDHIMAVGPVKQQTGSPFLLHPNDLWLVESGWQAAAARLSIDVEQPPLPDASLAHGDIVEVAGVRLEVIYSPGHTQGSVCFYAEKMLFSGDTLFQGTVGRTDLPGGDHPQMISSIVDRLLPLPDETIVLPGHMLETSIAQERQTNPFILQELQRRGPQ